MTTHLILYIRKNHPASLDARQWSDSLQPDFPHELEVRDVEENPAWQQVSGASVPAAEVDGRRLPAPLTLEELKSAFAVARAISVYQKERRSPVKTDPSTGKADRMATWFSRHWLAVFNGFISIYLGLALLAPVLMKAGATEPASWIYAVYSYSCHELGFRSFYLFGEKAYYPRDEFAAATGIDPNDWWEARLFRGNETLGYKVSLCERDVAIYSSLILAGIAFSFFRRKIKPLHWIWWIILGILPMGIDGGSQLLSYLPLGIFPVRESTVFLRVVTGAMFGIASAWFAYPYVHESMDTGMDAPPPKRK